SVTDAVVCVQTDFWCFTMKPKSFRLTISRVGTASHSAYAEGFAADVLLKYNYFNSDYLTN
ncbi:MAG: hypothetical protein IJJ33_15060, partial [Victivallales bacterium]|nr:hypothetical protein [Victivallales bacterium]